MIKWINAMKRLVVILALAAGGCSSLVPSSKTQTMSVYALGIPGIAVITSSSQAADNSGEDVNAPTQANPVTVTTPIR